MKPGRCAGTTKRRHAHNNDAASARPAAKCFEDMVVQTANGEGRIDLLSASHDPWRREAPRTIEPSTVWARVVHEATKQRVQDYIYPIHRSIDRINPHVGSPGRGPKPGGRIAWKPQTKVGAAGEGTRTAWGLGPPQNRPPHAPPAPIFVQLRLGRGVRKGVPGGAARSPEAESETGAPKPRNGRELGATSALSSREEADLGWVGGPSAPQNWRPRAPGTERRSKSGPTLRDRSGPELQRTPNTNGPSACQPIATVCQDRTDAAEFGGTEEGGPRRGASYAHNGRAGASTPKSGLARELGPLHRGLRRIALPRHRDHLLLQSGHLLAAAARPDASTTTADSRASPDRRAGHPERASLGAGGRSSTERPEQPLADVRLVRFNH